MRLFNLLSSGSGWYETLRIVPQLGAYGSGDESGEESDEEGALSTIRMSQLGAYGSGDESGEESDEEEALSTIRK